MTLRCADTLHVGFLGVLVLTFSQKLSQIDKLVASFGAPVSSDCLPRPFEIMHFQLASLPHRSFHLLCFWSYRLDFPTLQILPFSCLWRSTSPTCYMFCYVAFGILLSYLSALTGAFTGLRLMLVFSAFSHLWLVDQFQVRK